MSILFAEPVSKRLDENCSHLQLGLCHIGARFAGSNYTTPTNLACAPWQDALPKSIVPSRYTNRIHLF